MTDEDDIILQPLTHASYAGRTLKGIKYQPPPQALDPYELDIETLEEMFDKSHRDLVSTQVVKQISVELMPMQFVN